MDPITIASIAKIAIPFLTSPRAPSQAQVDAALEAQRAAERQKWIIGGAIAGAGLLIYLVVSSRR